MSDPRKADGWNHLISKAVIAEEIHEKLLHQYPKIDHHMTIELPAAGTFHGTTGLRVWYQDTTIYCSPLSW